MLAYLGRRTLQTIPTIIGVVVVVFFFVRALPGDPARIYAGTQANAEVVEAVRERFGLDESLPEQFLAFVNGLWHGNLGISFHSDQPVFQVIAEHFLPTLWLSLAATILAAIFGVLAGVGAAYYRDSPIDVGLTVLATLGISTPSFFIALLLIYAFAVNLHLFPVTGGTTLRGLTLPVITLSVNTLATIARFARSSLLEVMGEDYIRTARAKGLGSTVVLMKHAFKNSLVPVVTIIGLQFGFLLGGTIITETVFNFPGMGWLLIQSINARDYPVIQGLLLVFALEFVLVNLLVDLLYGVLDPRISYD